MQSAEPEQKFPTGFGMFVRHHHKPQFLQTCADLMGLPTTGKSLELPGHAEESTTLPSELTHEDTKPGEGSLEDSLHPCPVTLSPSLHLGANWRETHKLILIAICRLLSVQET